MRESLRRKRLATTAVGGLLLLLCCALQQRAPAQPPVPDHKQDHALSNTDSTDPSISDITNNNSIGAGGQAAARHAKLTTMAVIGERHSGTNLVRTLLSLNLDKRFHIVWANFTTHKHYLQPPPPYPQPHTLVFLCVRNAYDWVFAMHRMCYCCERRSKLGFNEFLHDPFNSTNYPGPQDKWCPNADNNIFKHDRPFHNLINMRQWKLINHLNTSNWAGGLEVVQLERMLTPEATIQWLRTVAKRHNLILAAQPGAPPNSAATAPAMVYSALKHKVLPVTDQEAAEVVPVLRDARYWIKKHAKPLDRATRSVYLNPRLMAGDEQHARAYASKVWMINRLLDPEVEREVGYHLLKVPKGGADGG